MSYTYRQLIDGDCTGAFAGWAGRTPYQRAAREILALESAP